MPLAPFLRCVRRGNDKRTFSFAAIPRGVAVPVGKAPKEGELLIHDGAKLVLD